MEHDVEVIIGGETNDFGQRFAVDSGIALIETCHSASEEPGLRNLANDPKSQFDEVEVAFHSEAVPWATV